MSDIDIIRRTAERGLKLAQDQGPQFIDLFQHLLDEAARVPAAANQEALYRAMVDRFLGWKLPDDFGPDAGISFSPSVMSDSPYWPTGTNLLHAGQALEMFKHCVELPAAIPTGPVLHTPSGAVFDEVIAAAELGDLTPQADHQCCGKCADLMECRASPSKPANEDKKDAYTALLQIAAELENAVKQLSSRVQTADVVIAVLLAKAGGSVTLVDADGEAVIGKTVVSEADADSNTITFRLVDAVAEVQ